jgi:hypothetical protein
MRMKILQRLIQHAFGDTRVGKALVVCWEAYRSYEAVGELATELCNTSTIETLRRQNAYLDDAWMRTFAYIKAPGSDSHPEAVDRILRVLEQAARFNLIP